MDESVGCWFRVEYNTIPYYMEPEPCVFKWVLFINDFMSVLLHIYKDTLLHFILFLPQSW